MSSKNIALATCSVLPDLHEDDAPIIASLAEHGITAVPAIWDDATVDWSNFDATIVRSTWDYSNRKREFLTWAQSVPNIINEADIISWNTDKYYLKALGERGVPTIKTLWLDPNRHFSGQAINTRIPAFGDFIIKPTVSAGAQDTMRYQKSSAQARGEAIMHVKELLKSGRHVMVQPYLTNIDEIGETGLIFFQGEFSHAISKSAIFPRGHRPTQGLYQKEVLRLTEPTTAQLNLAQQVLDTASEVLGKDLRQTLYARIDLIPDDDGNPLLLELELIEPSLFLSKSPEALDRFTRAIVNHLGKA